MKPFKLGLIARIALLVIGVEVAAFSALGWFYTDQFSTAIVGHTNARLKLVGRMIANDELAISTLSRRQLMSDMVGAPYLDGMVIGGNGLVIVSTEPAHLGRPASDIPGFDKRWISATAPDQQFIAVKDTLTSVTHIRSTEGGAPVYYTIITISTADLNALKRNITLWGQLGSLLFILLSSAGIVLIAQRLITRRVNTSLATLKEVEQGNLDARIRVFSDDELGQLQRGINSMTDKVGSLLNQHRQNAEALKQQKDLLTSVIQHSPIRVFWKDRDLRYLGCNSQFAEDAGLGKPEELIGKTDFEMAWRDQAELYRADDLNVMETAIPKLDFEEPQTTPDGRTIWLSTSKVPLRGEDNQIIGVLGIYSDITTRKQAEDQIRNLAYFDPLTGLPNRRLLMDRLRQSMSVSIRNRQYGALLMLDLDNFKDLNDSQGHDVGDQLLVEVGTRLREHMRQADTVARLGGDEFVVVSESLGEDEASAAIQARGIAEKVRLALIRPYALKNGELAHYSTPSIGVTLFHGQDTSLDLLLKQADVAMYQAKSAGRNAIRFFSKVMQTTIEARAQMAMGLRNGLDRGELRLYYQPQVDGLGNLIGAEALLRWLPPDAAPISPAVFIPLAEETGLILPIGEWVFEQACLQLKRWEQDSDTRSLTLAVNVSAHQFRQPDFVERVQTHLDLSGIDPTRLKLELTESVMLTQVDEAIVRMQSLKQLGVSFSLDDFGTGFSSLSYLKRLPLDQIKIDQSFIRDISHDPNDAAIVRAILAMSESLGISVIAEGVETEDQRAFLLRHGCEHYQGYLFGKPLPIEEWPEVKPDRAAKESPPVADPAV
ncbi:MAG: EAL domain-containing protein [Parasulfuritortus sp.]|nr:EAL domain-containing protein [Parasulfuritortus sp.]